MTEPSGTDFRTVARDGGELVWLRADLAAVLVDREEQRRLEGLLDAETARVARDFPAAFLYDDVRPLGGP